MAPNPKSAGGFINWTIKRAIEIAILLSLTLYWQWTGYVGLVCWILIGTLCAMAVTVGFGLIQRRADDRRFRELMRQHDENPSPPS